MFGLDELGLPPDYLDLPAAGKREARLAVSRSWYDLDKYPDRFCTDPDAFVRWVKLFVEFYLKPAECNSNKFTLTDPTNKYDMVRSLALPPKVDTEPTKVILSATRGFTKTQTIVHQAGLAAVLARPKTEMLISEANLARTTDEMKSIKRQIEENDRIQADFGGSGELYPRQRMASYAWNMTDLEFLSGSKIFGRSCLSSIRGLHPDLIIVDDPEKDKKRSRNPMFRREFFDWYFFVWLPMLRIGKVSTWIGTPNNELSCLKLALSGRSDSEDQRDQRFDDHHKVYIKVIDTDPLTGERFSHFPDYISVQGYDNKLKTMGREGRAAEVDTDPIAGGDLVFNWSDFRHGYMKCVKDEGTSQESFYMLDMKTGETQDWEAWVESLAISGASDIADSLDPNSDPAATVIVGVDSKGIAYILDVWYRICLVDLHVPKMFEMCREWKCSHLGIEKVALQSVVIRGAEQKAKEYRTKGWFSPRIIPVPNHSQSDKKVRRIIGCVGPLVDAERIRMRRWEPLLDEEGETTHTPAKDKHKRMHVDLDMSLRTFTDEGTAGYLDIPDALEMALRVAGSRKGSLLQATTEDIEEQMEKWDRVGIQFDYRLVPQEFWTPGMKDRYAKDDDRSNIEVTPYGYGDDPYDFE